jgi:hypothetical protein
LRAPAAWKGKDREKFGAEGGILAISSFSRPKWAIGAGFVMWFICTVSRIVRIHRAEVKQYIPGEIPWW